MAIVDPFRVFDGAADCQRQAAVGYFPYVPAAALAKGRQHQAGIYSLRADDFILHDAEELFAQPFEKQLQLLLERAVSGLFEPLEKRLVFAHVDGDLCHYNAASIPSRLTYTYL